MRHSDEGEKNTKIAVQLLRTRDPQNIELLQNFLTYLPNPNCRQHVLTDAVLQLLQVCPETVLWMLQHSQYLKPQVDVIQVITQRLTDVLLIHDIKPGQDFSFAPDGHLQIHGWSAKTLSTLAATVDDPVTHSAIHFLALAALDTNHVAATITTTQHLHQTTNHVAATITTTQHLHQSQ